MTARLLHLPLSAQPVMPWANGGGSTRQVAIEPPAATLANGMHWRVSIATVGSDGPFSRLPGIDRSLWLLGGAGVRLFVDGREVVLAQALQRFDFAGEAAIHARLLAGACEDLNLMVARDRVSARAEVLQLPAGATLDVGMAGSGLVLAVRGRVEVRDASLQLAEREAVRFEGVQRHQLVASDGPCTLFVGDFAERR